MYPKNAATPPRIYLGPVVQISDGAVQTSGVTVTVTPEGGSETASGGTVAYSTKGGVWYTPTQAETNYSSFLVEAWKTGCIPAGATVVTTATSTPGTVVVTTNNDKTGYSLTATTGLGNQTANITGNLSGSVGSVTGAVGSVTGNVGGNVAGSVGSLTTNNDKTGYSLTATTGLGNQTANITGNLSGSVGSVTGAVGSVTGAVGSVTGAVGSVTGNVGGNVVGSVGSVTGAVGSVTGNVGGNVAGSVASVTAGVTLANDAVSAAAVAADALAEIADAVHDEQVDGTVTFRQSTRLANSANGAKLSGAATTTVVVRDLADSKDRITATVDADGNRTAVSRDLT